MTASTNQPTGIALRIGDADEALIDAADAAIIERVERFLASGGQPAVMIRPSDNDATGHVLVATPDLEVEVLIDDDTEGHTLNLHFPTAQAARDFQLKLIATGVLAGTLVVAGVGITAAPSIHLGAVSPVAVTSDQALRDFRAEEISLGANPAPATAVGLSDFRAEEISLGANPAPATAVGLSDFRAEEISLGANPAPATAVGLSDFRAEEISLGANPAPATAVGLSDFRAEEISLGANPAPTDTGYQDQRAGERGAASSTTSTTSGERKGGK